MDDQEATDPDFESEDTEPAPPPSQIAPPGEAQAPANDRAIQIVAPSAPLAVAPSWDLGLEPTTLGAAFKLARGLYDSGLYARFRNPAAIWAVIIRGRELGLGALTALDCFHVVEGRPVPSAHFLIARAKQHPDCEYLEFIEGNASFALWRGKARGREQITLRYTIEQARDAGLVKPNGAWVTRPDEMLRKTAGAQLSRLLFPGALQGLYAAEEMGAV